METLTTKKAADELGVKLHTVIYHIKKGSLAAEKAGAAWIIRREDLDRFKKRSRSRKTSAETIKERYGPDHYREIVRKAIEKVKEEYGLGALTSQEAADELGITRQCLRYYIRIGSLAAKKVRGGFWIIRCEDLDLFKNAKAQYAPDLLRKIDRKKSRKGGRKRLMTESRIEVTTKLLASGVSPQDVAEKFGVRISVIYRWVPASERF